MVSKTGGARSPGRLAALLGLAALFVPLTIVAHELAHLTVALAFGFDATLHFSAIDPGPQGDRPDWMAGLVGLAGPFMTAMLVLAGILSARRRPKAAWPPALAVAAASRFSVGVPYTLVSLYVALAGQRLAPPEFDEYKAGTALGISGNLLLGLSSLVVIAVLAWLIRSRPRGARILQLLSLLLGTGLGWYLWMGLLGPRLLP